MYKNIFVYINITKMFYSLLFPVWILLQKKNMGLYHHNELELDTSISNDKDDKLVLIKKKQNQ